MREHNLSYIDELEVIQGKMFKGCIARMMTRRKVEMVNSFVFLYNYNFTTLTNI